MKKYLLGLFLLLSFSVNATNYDQDIVDSGSHFNESAFGGATVVGGDTITYEVGNHTGKQYFNGYHGSDGNPIVLIFTGADIDGGGSNIILDLAACSYLKIIGGTFHNSSTQGISGTSSWAIEIDGTTVYNCTGTAIRIGYQSVSSNPSKWRASFIDPYAIVTNCTVYETYVGGEGIYLGASNPQRINFIDGVAWQYCFLAYGKISGNTCYNIWMDAIQIGSCLDAHVFDNYIYDYAVGNDPEDKNGIQMGKGTRGLCYNNFVRGSQAVTDGAMYFIQGDGVLVFNNIGIDGFNGINVQAEYTTSNTVTEVYNNTFVDLKKFGAYVNASQLRMIKIENNIFHHAVEPNGSTTKYLQVIHTPSLYFESNNIHTYEAIDSKASLFVDTATEDFTLIGGSSALGGGKNLKWFSSKLMKTYSGEWRNFSGGWDLGAEK